MDFDLETRLKKLMVFRVVMVTTLLLIAAYVEAVSETLLAVNPLYFVVGATYALTVGHAVALRLVPSRLLLAYAQIVGDLLTVTALVHLTGTGPFGAGTRAGFLLLYPLAVLASSVVLPRRGAAFMAALATLLYGALLWAVHEGVVPPLGLFDVPYLPAKALLYFTFVLGVACATVTFVGSYLAESLQHAGRRLQEAAVEVADLRELNQVIVNSIQSGLITTDGEGRVLHLNGFGESILGRRATEIRGRPLREALGSVLLGATELQTRASSRALARLDVGYVRPDGRRLDLGFSVTPLAAGKGIPGGYLVVFQDLTDIRRLEDEVRTKEKLAAVGEMAAQLAHEIRNPLGSIRGSAQVLMSEGDLSEEQGTLLAIITRESKRLSDTLNRFLFQVRAPSRPRSPVDLKTLIGEAVTLLRSGSEFGEAHEIAFEADAGPHLCAGDPDQITQVFWNLARNGLEAMPGGGRLEVELRRAGEDVVLTVRDRGRGMGKEEQRRMFEPFQSGSPMGTGLGLAIVYRIVREHGGDINVKSAPDQGTEVEVRLPLVSVVRAAAGR